VNVRLQRVQRELQEMGQRGKPEFDENEEEEEVCFCFLQIHERYVRSTRTNFILLDITSAAGQTACDRYT